MLLDRLKNRFKFQIEQLLLRGAHSRLLFIASLVGLVAIAGGLLVQATNATFENNKTAIWWAFLRLTDPGYLGDDEGVARRVISTTLKVSFRELKDISADRGEIALGVRLENSSIDLNPVQNKTYILKETADLIVLVREDAE